MDEQLDIALQSACPCVTCPRFGTLRMLEDDMHRFVVGYAGLYIEVRRPWAHVIRLVAPSSVPLPYGQPPEMFRLKMQRTALADGLRRFIGEARKNGAQEHAAWLTFTPGGSLFGYAEPSLISRSSVHVRYERLRNERGCLPVVDCHSHGMSEAFFSETDDLDDCMDDIKLSFVVGSLDQAEPSVAMRLVGLGLCVDISEWICSVLYPGSIGIR